MRRICDSTRKCMASGDEIVSTLIDNLSTTEHFEQLLNSTGKK